MATESSSQKFNFWTLTAMVVGSMVGAGIFRYHRRSAVLPAYMDP